MQSDLDPESEDTLPDLGDPRGRFFARDFFVDFLGGLVPGMLFLLGLAFTILPTLHAVGSALSGIDDGSLGERVQDWLKATEGTPGTIWVIIFLVLVTIAYVVGHIFYRRDPSKPDKTSFRRLLKERPQSGSLEGDFACQTEDECEFPYPHFGSYLAKRGHERLLPLVTWVADGTKRSKTYINLLKIRLRYHHPDKCAEIIRNEAHVRLASSTWYVIRALRYSCWAAIGLTLLVVALSFSDPQAALSSTQTKGRFADLFLPTFVLTLSEFGRSRIERFFHYQRLREIFYVLETAYTAFRGKPSELGPPFLEFEAAMLAPSRCQPK